MPISAIVYIGESFAEMGLVEDQKLKAHKTWYLGRESLGRSLTQFFSEHQIKKITHLNIVHKGLLSVLNRRLGSPPAFLVTEGFEHWLTMNRQIKQSHFTVQAERASSLLDDNLIFGLGERINAQGQIEKAIDLKDVEFIATKLQLNKVEEIAVGLLHSNVNPAHELEVGETLKKFGFKVHLSHQMSENIYETSRWWKALTNAYLAPHLREIMSEIKTAMEASGTEYEDIQWLGGHQMLTSEQAQSQPSDLLFGAIHMLSKWRQKIGAQSLLYLGVEDFLVLDGRWPEQNQWKADFGTMALQYPGFQRCDIQATQLIHQTFWGQAGFDQVEGGFEPGPMCMGRGLQLQYLDVLWVNHRLDEIPGLIERMNEKSRMRIEESLYSLGRWASVGTRHLNPKDIADSIENEGAVRLASQIPLGSQDVMICGPLASSFKLTLDPILAQMGIKRTWTSGDSVGLQAMQDWCE